MERFLHFGAIDGLFQSLGLIGVASWYLHIQFTGLCSASPLADEYRLEAWDSPQVIPLPAHDLDLIQGDGEFIALDQSRTDLDGLWT